MVAASPGEFEPASFVIHAFEDITSLQIHSTPLTRSEGSIAANNVDVTVVECWYQSGETILNEGKRVLTPELLLKDDSLVKVVDGDNYLNIDSEYILISNPKGIAEIPVTPSNDEFPVKDTAVLQPVDIAADTKKAILGNDLCTGRHSSWEVYRLYSTENFCRY